MTENEDVMCPDCNEKMIFLAPFWICSDCGKSYDGLELKKLNIELPDWHIKIMEELGILDEK